MEQQQAHQSQEKMQKEAGETNMNGATGESISSEIDGLTRGISTHLKSFLGHYPEAIHHAANYLEQVGHTWSAGQLEEVSSSIKGALSPKSQGKIKEKAQSLSKKVSKNPTAVLAGALLVGVASGVALQRLND